MNYSDQIATEPYSAAQYNSSGQVIKPASKVEYYGGQSRIELTSFLASSTAFLNNRGLTVYTDADLVQNKTTTYAYKKREFGKHADYISMGTSVVQESKPGATDMMDATIRFYDSPSGTTPFHTSTFSFQIAAGKTFTDAQLMAIAVADNTELNDPATGKLLDTMINKGGQAKRTAESILAGVIKLEPLLLRPDSSAYVTTSGGNSREEVGYLAGYSDLAAESLVGPPNAVGMRIHSRAGMVYVNRTLSIATKKTRPIKEMMDFVVHESVHLLDERPNPSGFIEKYKTEFRAYWMEGDPVRDKLSTAFDPSMDNKGPKSAKARDIFEYLYFSTTYSFVKQQYDSKRDFREEVNRYIFPDGINLIVSVRIENLRKAVYAYAGTAFDVHKREITGLYGLTKPEDKTEISGNRMWQDLVEKKYTDPVELKEIKTILNIP